MIRSKSVQLGTILGCALLLASTVPGQAQQSELQLTLARNFGFRAGNRIQGQFTLGVNGPDDLASVAFLIDRRSVAEIEQPPFEYRFHTGDFALGVHELAAVGVTGAGQELRSPARSFEFVSAEDSFQAVGDVLIPLAIGVAALMLLGTLGPALLGRKKAFELGVYGTAGGSVCPRCEKPYSRSLLSPNLVAGKLERCPHCGKWAIVRRATPAELEAAEQRVKADSETPRVAPDDDLQRAVDESRFEG